MEQPQLYDLEPLFRDVQMQAILPDGKTFPDSIAKLPLPEIALRYRTQQQQPGFSLQEFIEEHFILPVAYDAGFHSDTSRPIEEHIRVLWNFLTRQPAEAAGSLLRLPYPYIVPGGRFREIYYWDSYFTMLGLRQHGNIAMIENMVRNFAYLIENFGHIPNGNRSYYLSRSQPPFFALMVSLLAEAKNDERVFMEYLYVLQKEYDYWQYREPGATAASHHSVLLSGGELLNRYFDAAQTPRQESYAEDVHLGRQANRPAEIVFANIRAGAESGWDFSSRWLADQHHLATIETINIIPVDLNCLLYKLEQVLSKSYSIAGDPIKSATFHTLAVRRAAAIFHYCWNDNLGFFTDYNWVSELPVNLVTAAGLLPLFVMDTADEQVKTKLENIKHVTVSQLLQPGGIVTTTINSGQQWDAPNGWAPLQWIAVCGFDRFGEKELARVIAGRWTALNRKVFEATGKMMEKYDVMDVDKLAGGGEYESQDGFGWTNGVYLALEHYLKG